MSRSMGIDVGTKRTGVAFSDLDGVVATAHSTIDRTEVDDVAEELASLAEEREVQTAVFGWPVRMDGTEGRAVANVREMIERFEEAVQERGLAITIERWDERMTSQAAESVLIEADLTRQKRKGIIDRVAATRILQNYLDAGSDH